MTESRPKVLSIDDNLSLNSMRQMVLSVSGFDCDLAVTAEQALAMVLTSYYDAILLDYYLPGTTGTQVAKTIKTLRPQVPIIVVTGEEVYEHSDAVHSYVIKGEGPEVLLARLRAVVTSKSMIAQAMHAAAS